MVKEEYNTGAHNVFHISRLKKAADTAAEAKKLELPRWMRKGFPSKITVEDRDYMYEISGIVGHPFRSARRPLDTHPTRVPRQHEREKLRLEDIETRRTDARVVARTAKLQEQYQAFAKFNEDYVSRTLKTSDLGYVS